LPRALLAACLPLAGQAETARETATHSEPDIPFATAARDERQGITRETGLAFAMDFNGVTGSAQGVIDLDGDWILNAERSG